MSKIIPASIVLFWLVMTGIFIQREIIPSLPQLTQPSYKALLKSPHYMEGSKMGIYFGGKRIGSSTTTVSRLPDKSFRIENSSLVKLPLGGGFDPKVAITGFSIVKDYKLDSFQLSVNSDMLHYAISGAVKGNMLELSVSDGRSTRTERIPMKDDATLSDGLAPFISMPNLSVGKEWSINLINPMKMSLETVKARVENLTTMQWNGKECEVYEVVIDLPGKKIAVPPKAYITKEGRILKQEMLFPGTYLLREE
ncbi:MAG: hypothetical protein V1701_03185 [Planctomycetota bacterium]